jgi:hypothetical protein
MLGDKPKRAQASTKDVKLRKDVGVFTFCWTFVSVVNFGIMLCYVDSRLLFAVLSGGDREYFPYYAIYLGN